MSSLQGVFSIFRAELIGRFDAKIVFKRLSLDMQREIGHLVISEELAQYKERGFSHDFRKRFRVSCAAWHSQTLDARSMKRTVQKDVGNAIRDAIKCCAPSSGIIVLSPMEDKLMLFADGRPIDVFSPLCT